MFLHSFPFPFFHFHCRQVTWCLWTGASCYRAKWCPWSVYWSKWWYWRRCRRRWWSLLKKKVSVQNTLKVVCNGHILTKRWSKYIEQEVGCWRFWCYSSGQTYPGTTCCRANSEWGWYTGWWVQVAQIWPESGERKS